MEPDVMRGFDEIKAILRTVAERQAAAEKRMDRAEARLDRAEARLKDADARAEVRFERAEARLGRAEARAEGVEGRMERMDARFEKRMRGFEKLVKIGFTELRRFERETDERFKETDERINALIDTQQRTEASLRAFLDGLRRGGNGHRGGRAR